MRRIDRLNGYVFEPAGILPLVTRIGEFVGALALWTIFVSTFASPEILAGCAAALITVTIFELLKRAEPLQFRPPAQALAQAWRLPGLILRGNWTLLEELWRRMLGHRRRSALFITQFPAVGENSRASGIRALAIIYATLPPNFLIVGMDRASGLMLYHQIRKEPVPEIIHRLESA